MKIEKISVAKDFTDSPGARYISDGKFSGQRFYEEILKPKVDIVWDDNDKKIFLDLDDVIGYASSFISEVFSRLKDDFLDTKKIKEKIEIKSDDDPFLLEDINDILDNS